jgi:hypothetical protein
VLLFCAIGKKCPVARQKLTLTVLHWCILACIMAEYMAKTAHQHTHGELAKRYGVTRSAVQGWERRGLSREWTLEKIDEWRQMHAAGRVVIPPRKPDPMPVSFDAATPPAPKPTAEQVITEGMSFQETRTMKLRKEIERLSIIIQREKGELVLSSEVRETATRVVSVWCSELDALVGDLPGQLAGLTEADIQPRLRARIELLKANARQSIETL